MLMIEFARLMDISKKAGELADLRASQTALSDQDYNE